MTHSRRTFVIQSLTGAGALACGASYAQAQTSTSVAVPETDPQAIALGYKTDGSTTDKAKHPNYNASQSCSGCLLFQGKLGDASAPCAAFGSKLVAGKGWCSAWAKRV